MAGIFETILEAPQAAVSAIGGGAKKYFGPEKIQRQDVLGVGQIGGDPNRVEDEYQRRLREQLAQRQRAEEARLYDEQRQRILGAMQPYQGAQATLGAARSQGGIAGAQTSGLAALGAGQAQQAGMVEARQVQAQEEQRNALAQAQLAEMLRQQELARIALERGDVAQALGAQRALLVPEIEMQQQYAAAEAERARRMQGATAQGLATLGASAYDAYSAYEKEQQKKADDEFKRVMGF
jgi:hypothetical protein